MHCCLRFGLCSSSDIGGGRSFCTLLLPRSLVAKSTVCVCRSRRLSFLLLFRCFSISKKAFDTVDHHILLKKLYAYGICGHIIKWFEHYLYDRSQYVIYNHEYSETHPIKCGVPQGSILGPLLFIIYVNDICNISNFLFNIMYADDTSVLLSGDELKDLTCLLNKELEILFILLKSNKLSLNTQNTFYMLFHRARIKSNNSVVKINDSVLNRVNNMKYLGVIIDHKLKWCEHISYVKNKVSKGHLI